MALSILKTQVDAGTIEAADWNAEFNNIYNNPMSLISPMTANLDGGGFSITNITILGAAPATPVAKALYEDSIVKGWCDWSVDGTINDDINVTTLTDTGTGDWTVNWVTDFASANYGVALAAENGTTRAFLQTGTPVAGSVQVVALDNAGSALDLNGMRIIAIGNN